jgi:predicted AAA+ superfamily ATPase
MINRETYIKKLIGFKDKQLIKIITGIRRCGKSTLLDMFQEYLIKTGVKKSQIIAINFENLKFKHLRTVDSLYEYIQSKLIKSKKNYIFIDEIQMIENFPMVIDSFFIDKNIDIYLTGSNAYMLSGEIATLLSGRYVEIKMLPLSFGEYSGYIDTPTEIAKKYSNYLEYSSFPYSLELYGDYDRITEYLMGIYNTIILKDIVARYKINDVMMLESIVEFLFDNIGSTFSTKKISDTMTSNGRKTSTHTVENYISALIDSFIIYRAKRYDIKGKQYLKTLTKYYVVDIGLRQLILGKKMGDIGHILENVIFLELLNRGYKVFIGKIDDMEIDFIGIKNGVTEYYQVAATIRDEKTFLREISPLEKINDHNQKFILTLDYDPESEYKGIKIMNALDFLLKK